MTEVERFYDHVPSYEWGRLDHHRMEFAIALRAFSEFFPSPPAKVIDIGGGPGRYALELTRRGYPTTLVDLSSRCLALAREKAEEAGVVLEGCIHADARDLSEIGSASFDAALLMGPLYHILDETGRRRAVQETLRVLKPQGIIHCGLHLAVRALSQDGEHQSGLAAGKSGLCPPTARRRNRRSTAQGTGARDQGDLLRPPEGDCALHGEL